MATFTGINKSSQSSFTPQTKDTDAWTLQTHSDVLGAGMDVQMMDNTTTGMDQGGNAIVTLWSVPQKK